ncbi:glutaredoxin [Hypoxylon trugodes]|uniref:glutaredoxin n=1 Tax=Hypoxylon trugodes TaxID=326681 RepID=UPI0021A1B632|nr:glutaredoxin [Hypoxylon trugodes]KAI1386865.1 glutaredoxin [Hypoxylon trugodes]
MAPLQDINTPDEWSAHVAALPSSTLLVIFFHAPWAAPCTQMRAVLEALAEDYPKEGTSWVAVNAEEVSDVSETYDVTAVPYIVLQRNDKVLETISGSNAALVRKAIEGHVQKTTNGVKTNGVEAAKAEGGDSVDIAVQEEEQLNPEEEIRKRLEGLVKAAPVMLFMKGTPNAPQCGFSRQMVNILRERSVKYGFFNILADDDVRQGLKKFADWPTYPQLWVSGELVGGLDIVKEELDNDPEFFKEFSVPAKEEGAAAA